MKSNSYQGNSNHTEYLELILKLCYMVDDFFELAKSGGYQDKRNDSGHNQDNGYPLKN